MPETRTTKRPGPLPHQQRMRRARERRQLRAVDQRSTNTHEAIQEMDSGVAQSLARAQGIRAAMDALAAVLSPAPGLPLTTLEQQRAICITHLDDGIVIEVGGAELRLTHEEAARLFAMLRGPDDQPQQNGGA